MAFPIPEPYGAELQGWRERFGDPLATAIPPHVTLLPPTDVERRELPPIITHLRTVAAGQRPFRMHLRGTGTFRPVSPVVFVSLAAGISHCERIERLVRAGPLARPLRFPYHPHVTVVHGLADGQLEAAFDKLATYDVEFTVAGFSLYEHGRDRVWRPREHFGFP